MISPKEIAEIQEIGTLDGQPVRMLRTIGGLFVAAGKPKGKQKDEALAAASHGAIARYQVMKQYGERFQPAMIKSEDAETTPTVHEWTQLLEKSNVKDGFKMYAVVHPHQLEMVITHSQAGNQVLSQKANLKPESYEIQDKISIDDVKLAKSLKGIAGSLLDAIAEEALLAKREFVSVQTQPRMVKAKLIRKG